MWTKLNYKQRLTFGIVSALPAGTTKLIPVQFWQLFHEAKQICRKKKCSQAHTDMQNVNYLSIQKPLQQCKTVYSWCDGKTGLSLRAFLFQKRFFSPTCVWFTGRRNSQWERNEKIHDGTPTGVLVSCKKIVHRVRISLHYSCESTGLSWHFVFMRLDEATDGETWMFRGAKTLHVSI